MRRIGVAVLAVVAFGFVAGVGSDAGAAPPPKDWEVELLAYAWIPSLDASIDLAGVGSRHVDTSLLDTINSLSLGAMGRASGRYHRFVGILDFMWAKLEDSDHFGGLGRFGASSVQADIETQSAYVQALGGYRVYRREGGLFGAVTPEKTFGIDLLTGLTWTWMGEDIKIDYDRDALLRSIKETRHFHGSKDWVGPFVGLRFVNDFTPRLRLETYGGAGGFGVGSSPDISWQLTTLLSYRVTDHFFVSIGHRLVKDKFNGGGGEIDSTLHGPMVGAGLRF